jgi:hypothetical protein
MQEIGDVIVESATLVKRAMPVLSDVDRKAVEITGPMPGDHRAQRAQ